MRSLLILLLPLSLVACNPDIDMSGWFTEPESEEADPYGTYQEPFIVEFDVEVRSAVDQSPIPGAEVHLSGRTQERPGRYMEPVTTDHRGRAILYLRIGERGNIFYCPDDSPIDYLHLWVDAPGFLQKSVYPAGVECRNMTMSLEVELTPE